MTNLFTTIRNSKLRANQNSRLNQMQETAKDLDARRLNLYDKIEKGKLKINNRQVMEIKRIREEFGVKMLELTAQERELAESLMKKEIEILMDLKGEYQYVPPQIVDTAGNPVK